MNVRARTRSVLLVSLGLFSPAVLADAGQFYVAPGLQWMHFDDTTDLDKDSGYFVGFGYDLTDRISAELNTFDLDPDVAGGGHIDVDHYKLDVIYNFNGSGNKLAPFIVGGIGNSNLGGENESLWSVGGGISYKLSDNWSWRTGVRAFRYFEREQEDQDWGIDTALVYRFGCSKSRPAAAPAPVAKPAVATTAAAPALDSDQDGVSDSADNCPDTPRNYAVDSKGCPIAVEELARVELQVNFDFDRAEVKPEYYAAIEQVTKFMTQYPDVIIELEGHTDSRGDDKYNLGLSDRRAAAVRQVMIDRFKIQASRISARGFGESQPVATNETTAGRAKNRRVMTVVIKTLQNYRPR